VPGHQAIAEVFGGAIVRAGRLMHGKTSMITHYGHPLFSGIDSPFERPANHSLVVAKDRVPAELDVIAHSDDGEIMGLAHGTHPTYGVQFHPSRSSRSRANSCWATFWRSRALLKAAQHMRRRCMTRAALKPLVRADRGL